MEVDDGATSRATTGVVATSSMMMMGDAKTNRPNVVGNPYLQRRNGSKTTNIGLLDDEIPQQVERNEQRMSPTQPTKLQYHLQHAGHPSIGGTHGLESLDEQLYDDDEDDNDQTEYEIPDEALFQEAGRSIAPAEPTTARTTMSTASDDNDATGSGSPLKQPPTMELQQERNHDDDVQADKGNDDVYDILYQRHQRDDLYSFERYQENCEWRSVKRSSPMRAKAWKSIAAKQSTMERSLGADEDEESDYDSFPMLRTTTLLTTTRKANTTSAISSTTKQPSAQDALLLSFVQRPTSTSTIRRGALTCRMSRAPIVGKHCVHMTLRDGSRIYIPVQQDCTTAGQNQHNNAVITTTSTARSSSLNTVSIDSLIQRVHETRRKREHQLSKTATTQMTTSEQPLATEEVHDSTNVDETTREVSPLRQKERNDSIVPLGTDNSDKDAIMSDLQNPSELDNSSLPLIHDEADELHRSKRNGKQSKKSSNESKKVSNCSEQRENSMLWVDKHAPSCFAHLLSDDRCNREVVRALRAWDPYVFGREPPQRPDFYQQRNSNNNHLSVDNKHSRPSQDSKGKNGNKEPNDKRPDESNRVILLSGPPGVGKTTLAHIVARHAGYRPIEVNGSDERTETSLVDRVSRAMESSTIDFGVDAMGSRTSNKPNCLILDEIDGADASKAIQSIVNIIRAEIPRKGTKSKVPYLRRPIIFICNNKYVPALKPLLPYARQFNVAPPSTVRLVERLRAILVAEKLTLSGGSSLLNQLVATSCGDIRSCLFTLQFASAKAKDPAATTRSEGGSTIDISSALQSALNGHGMKDERNDIGGTITTIFRKEKADQFGAPTGKMSPKSTEKVLDAVNSFGDNSRVLDSLFMNVLRVMYTDPTLDRCVAAHEWLSSSDIYRSNKSEGRSGYAMEAMHLPVAAAAIHLFCRVEQRSDLTFSTRELADAQYHFESNVALTKKTAEGASLRAKSTRSVQHFSMDTVPYALWALSAGEGSCALARAATSVELLSQGERQAFDRHASTLRSLGLSYVPEVDDVPNNAHAAHQRPSRLRLEPPIERLVQYVDLPSTRRTIPLALKQMLSRAATLDGILDTHSSSETTVVAAPSAMTNVPVTSNSTFKGSEKPAGGATLAINESQKGDKTEAVKRKAPPTNFLLAGARQAKAARSARCAARVGCLTNAKAASKQLNRLSNTGSGIPLSRVVRLKYVKGFTQAVSTPCRLEDLV